MRMYFRKGFTMVELMVVIAVIGILAAMTTHEAAEFIATARARAIVSNMHNLKKALLAWYSAHPNMVVENGGNYMVKYYTNFNEGSMTGGSPIQELWEERSGSTQSKIDNNPIGTNKHNGAKSFLARYLENGGDIKVSGTNTEGHKNYYSPIIDDAYLVHDNDTEGGVGAGATKRTAWYVGYSIPQTSMGERVKKKLAGMAKSQGLLQSNRKTTTDNTYKDARQVWMLAIDFVK